MIDASISVVLVDRDITSLRQIAPVLEGLAPSNLYVLFSDYTGALEYLRGKRADMLIADVSANDGEGFGFISEARNLQPWLRFVCMSGDASDALESMRLKADDFILKPCSDEALLHVLLSAPGGC